MQFIIDSVLTPLITEERKDVILSCVASLESLDYQAALDELHQVVEMKDGMCDNEMLVSRIDDIIWHAHETVFKQHEVQVSMEADQEVRQSIVDVLSNFDKYVIPDQLLLLFEGGFMPEEILAQMCQLFTQVKADEVWPMINDVSPRLLNTMREEIERQVRYRGLEDADPTPIQRVKMVNDFIRTFGEGSFTMLLDLSRNGVRIGTREISPLIQQSLEALDRKEVEVAAIEMFGLLLLSNTPVEEIARKIRDLIGDFTDNNIDNTNMLNTIKPLVTFLEGYTTNEDS
ncbi:putative structural head protein [Pseudomonas phage D6]|nr:putative structural head protein [Pseudomonas phage D6]